MALGRVLLACYCTVPYQLPPMIDDYGQVFIVFTTTLSISTACSSTAEATSGNPQDSALCVDEQLIDVIAKIRQTY